MFMSREINMIVVHCSATPPTQLIGAHEIREMHTMPRFDAQTGKYHYLGKLLTFDELPENVQGRSGRGWLDIGYHNVIRRNGALEHGRDISIPGAHAKGFNKNSVGVCIVGGVDQMGRAENNFEENQFTTLRGYLDTMLEVFPGSKLCGHRDLSVDLNGDGIVTPNEWMKECPSFDVKEWYYG